MGSYRMLSFSSFSFLFPSIKNLQGRAVYKPTLSHRTKFCSQVASLVRDIKNHDEGKESSLAYLQKITFDDRLHLTSRMHHFLGDIHKKRQGGFLRSSCIIELCASFKMALNKPWAKIDAPEGERRK